VACIGVDSRIYTEVSLEGKVTFFSYGKPNKFSKDINLYIMFLEIFY